MIRTYTVTVDTARPVSESDMAEHIATSVLRWGGGYEPEDPFFPGPVGIRAVAVRHKHTGASAAKHWEGRPPNPLPEL